MVKETITSKVMGPDEIMVTVIDYVPEPNELVHTKPLPKGLLARDNCGDGTDEYLHINPLVVWRQFPVLYFIDSSISSNLIPAVQDSFKAFNDEAGFELYKQTTNEDESKVQVSLDEIDSPGNTLARAQWFYSVSRKEITRATIVFDSRDSWFINPSESCGSNGNTFDIANVGTHEVGHISGLGHAPTDRLQTMYASTGPGQTLGRTLGNGDKKGFREAYKDVIVDPGEQNKPPTVENITISTEQNKPILIVLQGTDPEGKALIYDVQNEPDNGELDDQLGILEKVTYTPNTDYVGTDSFTYIAKDDKGAESNIGTVNITVLENEPEPTHELTKEEIDKIKLLLATYKQLKESGQVEQAKKALEDLENYMIEMLVNKHS